MSGQWRDDPDNKDRDYTVWQYLPEDGDEDADPDDNGWGVVELHHNPPSFFQTDYDLSMYYPWEIYIEGHNGAIEVPASAKTLEEKQAWAVAMWRMGYG